MDAMPASCCTMQAVTKEQLREWDLGRCLAALETLMAAVLAAGRQVVPFHASCTSVGSIHATFRLSVQRTRLQALPCGRLTR